MCATYYNAVLAKVLPFVLLVVNVEIRSTQPGLDQVLKVKSTWHIFAVIVGRD